MAGPIQVTSDRDARHAEAAVPLPDRYLLKRFIGRKGNNRAYLVHDCHLERDVALTLIETEGLDVAGLSRIRREAEAMGRLGEHPNIVTVHDIGEQEGDLYITSQFMDGGTLAELLEGTENHRLPVSEAVRVTDQICEALVHAHRNRIIHRDLAPHNILLNSEGTARLAGFGLAIALDNSQLIQSGAAVGTVAYMSPEQTLGHEVDERSDLYSLGALLYEMVSGRTPFQGDDVMGVISQHINTLPVAPSWHNPEIPHALETLILRLLAKEPERRPESASAVRDALRAIPFETARPAKQGTDRKANPLDRLAAGVFVGRSQELAILRAALEDAFSGRGGVILLRGEPGVGKTRITDELGTYARLRKAKVLTGRCYEGKEASALRPWIQMIRSYAESCNPKKLKYILGAGASDIAQIAPEVAGHVPGLPTTPPVASEQARYRLFDSIMGFLKNAGNEQPLVLIIDDLHWADKQSLAFFRFLAEGLDNSPLLVIGTYRDVEIKEQAPLRRMLEAIEGERLVRQITLRGLSETEVARFIEIMVGLKPPQTLATTVHKRTGGNPFFMSEVVRLLAADGRLECPQKVNPWHLTIPPGVREVIGHRLGRLSRPCREILSIASVVGQEFDVEILKRVSGLSKPQVVRHLQEALASRLLINGSGATGRYRFSHALVSEALCNELAPSHRIDLHRRIGKAIEEIYQGNSEEQLDRLAHHFFEAAPGGMIDKAIDYCQRAGGRAAALYAYEDSVGHYAHALQALSTRKLEDNERRYELLLAMGEALAKAGEKQQGKETLLYAAAIARRIGSPEKLARAALGLNRKWAPGGNIDRGWITLLEEALAALGDDDSVLRAKVLASLAVELYYSDCFKRRAALSKEAVDVARRVGDPATLAFTLYARHVAIWTPENTEERLAIATEIVRLAEKAGDSDMVILGHKWREIDLIEIGDIDEANAEFEIIARLAEELRQPVYRWYAALSRTMRALLEGRLEESERLAQEALSIGEKVDTVNAHQAFAAHLFGQRTEEGRLGELEEGVKGFVEQIPGVPIWRAALAYLYCEQDREKEARREFDALASNDFTDIRYDDNWVAGAAILSWVCAWLGDAGRAAKLYKLLRPFARRNIIISLGIASQGSVSYFLGVLASTMKRWKEATDHFEFALEMNGRIGGRPWVAHTQHEYAKMLFHRGRPGNREVALQLLSSALTTFKELGMKAYLEKALALKLELQRLPAVMANGPGEPPQEEPAPDAYMPKAHSGRIWQMLRMFLIGRIGVMTSLVLFTTFVGLTGLAVDILPILILTIGSALLSLPYYLIARRKPSWLDMLFYFALAVDVMLITMGAYYLGRDAGTYVAPLYAVIVAISATTFSKRRTYVIAGLGAVSYAALMIAVETNLIQGPPGILVNPNPMTAAIINMIFLGSIAFIAGSLTGITRSAMARSGELETSLRILNRSLEHRVAEGTRELKKTNFSLVAKNFQLERLNQEIKLYTRAVSHDVRSPVAAASEALRLLENLPLEEQVRRILIASDNIGRADRMLLGLRDLMRYGGPPGQTRLVPSRSLIEEVIEEVRAGWTSRGPRIRLIGTFMDIECQADKLKHVFRNLLNNAMTHMDGRAGALIEVGQELRSGSVACWVRDNGKGIPTHYHSAIFEPFRRVPNGKPEGVGLGLALVRQIVEQHGGKTWVESAPGKGATFWFTIPRNGRSDQCK